MAHDTNVSLPLLYRTHQGKVSIKWEYYLVEYERRFAAIRTHAVRLLEIGVQNGGSLEIWAKYFANAEKLVGCDINPQCSMLAYDDKRISIITGDASQSSTRDEIARHAGSFHIIIDDGSHRSSDVVKSFTAYFPFLEGGGVYVIEDMHASYWQEYEGGLYHPYSSMSFFKRLADAIHYDCWMNGKTLPQFFENMFQYFGIRPDVETFRQIHSIEFANSLCIVRKAPFRENSLGAICVAGTEERIAPGHTGTNCAIRFPDQSGNSWSTLPVAPAESFESERHKAREMEHLLDDAKQRLDRLNSEVLTLRSNIHAMQNSRSWRLTSILRYFNGLLTKKENADGECR